MSVNADNEPMVRADRYGRGSAAANGGGFVDLVPGDTFAALEEQLKRRISERFDNLTLGISASIGSKRNASELAKHLAAGEEEEVHKFAAKNIGVLFANGKLGISHDDKKAVDEARAKPRILRVFSTFEFSGNPLIATITIKPAEGGLGLYAIEALDIMRDERLEVHLAAEPRHFKTTRLLLENRIAYYVGDVNRTHPKFVGHEDSFSTGRVVELLEGMLRGFAWIRNAPRFSIIIPCYNVAPYLRECLDSVCVAAEKVKERGEGEQWDCPLVEVICVDDGSTDGSGAILDEYVRRQSNNQTIPNQTIFKVIHQANRGLSAARNAALDQATGEWLVYLDGDDLLPEGALGACERAINANPDADIIRGHMLSFNDGERISIPKTTGAIRSVDLSGRIADFCTTGCFPQYVLKASTFGDLRFYGASWCEERPYGAKCAARIRIAVDVDDYVYAFRARAGSITHTPMSLDQFRGYLQATKDMMRTYSESGRSVDPGVIHRVTVAWMEHQVFFLCTHLKADAKVEAWRFWFDSLDELGCGLPVPAWFRFVRFVCRTTRSCVLAWGLCFLPEWLKMHGLHRQKRVVR